MSQHKRIYWNEKNTPKDAGEGMCLAHVHYLIGYCPQTIAYYREMATELRKTFPQAADTDIGCHQVTRSDWCKGFTLIVWNAVIERKEYEGWRDCTGMLDYNY